MAAYSDLNVKFDDDAVGLLSRIHQSVKLRYGTIAVNNYWEDKSSVAKKNKKDKPPPIPGPEEVLSFRDKLTNQKRLRLLSRFTLVLSDSGSGRMVQKDDIIQSYDIIAVQPTDEKMFNTACKALDVDIITFDMSTRLPYQFKRPALRVAIDKGVHFEICYCPMLRDATARRNIISNGQALVENARGKNIIISSCCCDKMDIRGPLDVANLGSLFGLSQEQAKVAVTTNCRKVILHAEARRTALGALKLTPIDKVEEGDEWLARNDFESSDSEEEEEEGESSPRKKQRS